MSLCEIFENIFKNQKQSYFFNELLEVISYVYLGKKGGDIKCSSVYHSEQIGVLSLCLECLILEKKILMMGLKSQT